MRTDVRTPLTCEDETSRDTKGRRETGLSALENR